MPGSQRSGRSPSAAGSRSRRCRCRGSKTSSARSTTRECWRTTDRYGYTSLRAILDRPGTILLLDHLTDPQNLGTLLRTARAFDIAGVVIPADRSASVTPAVVNASAGAVESLSVAQVVNINRAIAEIREHGRWVAALDTGPDTQSIFTTEIPLPVALVLGSEGRGVSRQVRAA